MAPSKFGCGNYSLGEAEDFLKWDDACHTHVETHDWGTLYSACFNMAGVEEMLECDNWIDGRRCQFIDIGIIARPIMGF